MFASAYNKSSAPPQAFARSGAQTTSVRASVQQPVPHHFTTSSPVAAHIQQPLSLSHQQPHFHLHADATASFLLSPRSSSSPTAHSAAAASSSLSSSDALASPEPFFPLYDGPLLADEVQVDDQLFTPKVFAAHIRNNLGYFEQMAEHFAQCEHNVCKVRQAAIRKLLTYELDIYLRILKEKCEREQFGDKLVLASPGEQTMPTVTEGDLTFDDITAPHDPQQQQQQHYEAQHDYPLHPHEHPNLQHHQPHGDGYDMGDAHMSAEDEHQVQHCLHSPQHVIAPPIAQGQEPEDLDLGQHILTQITASAVPMIGRLSLTQQPKECYMNVDTTHVTKINNNSNHTLIGADTTDTYNFSANPVNDEVMTSAADDEQPLLKKLPEFTFLSARYPGLEPECFKVYLLPHRFPMAERKKTESTASRPAVIKFVYVDAPGIPFAIFINAVDISAVVQSSPQNMARCIRHSEALFKQSWMHAFGKVSGAASSTSRHGVSVMSTGALHHMLAENILKSTADHAPAFLSYLQWVLRWMRWLENERRSFTPFSEFSSFTSVFPPASS